MCHDANRSEIDKSHRSAMFVFVTFSDKENDLFPSLHVLDIGESSSFVGPGRIL